GLPQSVEDGAAPLRPVAVIGLVIAKNTDIRRPEDLAQFDGPLKPLQVRLEGHVDFDLADGRADSTQLESVSIEKRLEILNLQIGQVEDVRVVDGRSEEHTSELQSRSDLVCRLLLEKK